MRIFFLIFLMLALLPSAFAQEHRVVADFNSGTQPNNLGQDWGAWNSDSTDPDQGCVESIEADDFKSSRTGYSVRIDYDVQSSKAAFNGFWMKLGGFDATPYEWLSFWVKGSSDGKFTRRFKVELKDGAGKRAVYLVETVTPAWQEVRIPFKKNTAISDWSKLSEFVVVFDDILATYKEGRVYLDQIEFQK